MYPYLRISMTTVVMTAARKTKPPKTPSAITAPRFSFAWWALVDWLNVSTCKGPEGSGTPVPVPACTWSAPLPAISLSCGWSLLWSFKIDDEEDVLCTLTLDFFDPVSLTVAICSLVIGGILPFGGTIVAAFVVVIIVVTFIGVFAGGVVDLIFVVMNGRGLLLVAGRKVARGGKVTVLVRDSSIWT